MNSDVGVPPVPPVVPTSVGVALVAVAVLAPARCTSMVEVVTRSSSADDANTRKKPVTIITTSLRIFSWASKARTCSRTKSSARHEGVIERVRNAENSTDDMAEMTILPQMHYARVKMVQLGGTNNRCLYKIFDRDVDDLMSWQCHKLSSESTGVPVD